MFPMNIFLFVHLERYCYGNIMLSISVSPFVHLGGRSWGDVMSLSRDIVTGTLCFLLVLHLFVHLGKHCLETPRTIQIKFKNNYQIQQCKIKIIFGNSFDAMRWTKNLTP